MKKKILKITSIVMLVILLAVISAVGTFFLIRNKNVKETGNIFGISWYNEDDLEFTITTQKELYEFARLSDYYSFKKQTVKLGADIVVNEGNASDWAEDGPKLRWTPIRNFAGRFDGQGHTISGIYGKSNGSKMALFVDTDYNCTIKNVKLVNSYFETSGGRGVASFVSNGGGKLSKLYSDAIFSHKGEYCGGIASKITNQTSFDECWFDGSITLTEANAGGIVDMISGGRATMNHCLFSGQIDQKYDFDRAKIGGLVGCIMKKATIILTDSLACGTLSVDTHEAVGSLFGLTDSGVNFTITNSYVSRDTYDVLVGMKGGNYTGIALALHAKDLEGVKAYQRTLLDFTRYWAVTEDSTPVLKCFAETVPSLEGVAKAYDSDWYVKGNYNFEITTREQLYGLMLLSASDDFTDVVINLGADIVFNEGKATAWEKTEPELSWYGIRRFQGTFDGQGHTISGIYLSEEDVCAGLFSNVLTNGDVLNLKLKNSYFESTTQKTAMLGSVVGDLRGRIKNVYSDAIVVSYGDEFGGIIGRVYDDDNTGNKDDVVEVSECWFDGKVSGGRNGLKHTSGVVGHLTAGDLNISHCLNTGTIASETDDRGVHLGGIFGSARGYGTLNISDCLNTGKIVVKRDTCVGSVIGRGWDKTVTINISNTYGTYESYIRGIGDNTASTVNGGVVMLPEKMLTGNNAYKYTTLDFPGHWAIVKEDTPILQNFASSDPSTARIKKIVDTSWYKADAKTMIIDSVEDLYGFMIVSAGDDFKEKTVKLGADIQVNAVDEATLAAWKDGSAVAENLWAPISGRYKGFAGTFDGQGHTISGIYFSSWLDFSGFFSSVFPTGVVKNFSIKDSYFECTTEKDVALGSVAGDLRGKMEEVYSNATIVSYGNQTGGLVGRAYDKDKDGDAQDAVVVTNCWFDGEVYVARDGARGASGIVGWLVDGDLNISHCLNSGKIASETKVTGVGVGGVFGTARGKGILNISDCLNTGDIVVKRDTCVGGAIGQGWDKKVTMNISNTYATYECYLRGIGDNTQSKVNGGVVMLPEKMLTGNNAYKYTTLDFPGHWAIVKEDTPILQNFASSDPSTAGIKKLVDTSWYKADAKTMIIDSVEDLYGFIIVSAGDDFKEKTVKLGADIQLNAVDAATLAAWEDGSAVAENLWAPISGRYKGFAGTFDGQGHTISGIYFSSWLDFSGFFSSVFPTGVVKNFSIKDSYFECTTEKDVALGSVVGDLRGKMENVYSNATIVSYGNQTGGLVGRAYDKDSNHSEKDAATVVGSWFDGEVYVARDGARGASGIVGWLIDGDLNISHCLNSGQIESETKVTGVGVGGIFGTARGKGTLNISDCLNTGDIVVKRDTCVGAVVGQGWDKTVTIHIVNTYATDESYARGIGDNTASKVKGDVVRMPKQYCLGTECYKWTLLDYTNYWAARKNDIPSLKYFEDQKLKQEGTLADTSWYDANDKKLYVENAEEFYGFAALVRSGVDFEGQTVYLDVKNDELKLDKASSWLPIGTDASPFAGTFDGQGTTINGLNISVDNGADYGLFGVTAKGSTLQNFSLKDSKITYSSEESLEKQVVAGIGTVCGTLGGELKNVYSDADIDSTAAYVGGLVAFATDGSSIENCWYDGDLQLHGEYATYGGGIVAVAAGGNIEIVQCLNTGRISNEKTTAAQMLGGIIGGDTAASQILIKDCIAAGKVTAKIPDYNGVSSIVGIGLQKDSTYKFDNVYTTDTSCSRTTSAPKSYAMYQASVEEADEITFMKEKYYLGTAGYQWTALEFGKDKWAARAGEVPAPETFVSDALKCDRKIIRADISWAETEPYYIDDEADFCGLARLVQNGNTFKGKTVYLRTDIKLNDVNLLDGKKTVTEWMNGTETPKNIWMPIGYDASTDAKPFEGRFTGLDGDKIHSISGIYVDGDWRSEGLFGRIGASAQIDNLILENSYIYNSNGRTGAVAGWMEGTLANVYVAPSVIVKGEGKNSAPAGAAAGGLVGFCYAKKTTDWVKNCWFAGDVYATHRFAGGLVGWAFDASIILSDCLFTGNVYSTYASASSTGGVIGHISGATSVALENCVSNGKVQVAHADGAGSVLGMIELSSNKTVASVAMKNVYTNDNCDGDSGATNGCGTGTIVNAKNFVGLPATLSTTEMQNDKAYIHTQLLLSGSSEDKEEKALWLTTANGPELVTFSKAKPATLTGQRINTAWYYNNWTKEADAKSYIISDAASMYGFSRLVNDKQLTFDSDTISLGKDINMNQGWAPSTDATTGKVNNLPTGITIWKPIGSQNGTKFKGIFDGNGYTISGLYTRSLSDKGTGLFGCIDSVAAKIQNVRLVDSYLESTHSRVGTIVGWAVNGTVQNVYSNATLHSTAATVGGLIGISTGNVTINSCWYDGKITTAAAAYEIGGMVGNVYAGTTAIDTCLYTGYMDVTYTNAVNANSALNMHIGGLCGKDNSTLIVTNSICAGNLDFTINNTKNATVNLSRLGTICGSHKANTSVTNTYDMIQARSRQIAVSDSWNEVTLPGGHTQNASAILDADASFKGNVTAAYGDAAVTKLTKLRFSKAAGDTTSFIWKCHMGALPIPEELSRSVATDISWYEASATEYYLADAADMYGLSKLVATGNTFEGKKIFLTADLEMNPMDASTLKSWIDGTAVPENSWTPIGVQNGTQFKGVFDGQGHEISGVYVSSTTDRGTGLFGCINSSNATVQNLRLVDSYIKSTHSRVGSIVGWAVNGTVQNVYSNATLHSTAATVGGLIGISTGNVTINSCWYDGKITTAAAAYEIGGMVGNVYAGTAAIDTCLYTGYMDVTYTNAVNANSALNMHIGGLCGKDNSTLIVTNSICAGNLDFTINNTKNATVNLSRLGTICGSHKANTSVTNTYDMIQARSRQIAVSDSWNEITLPGGHTQNASAILDADASFKGNVTAAYGDAAVTELTKLRFSRATGDTTSLIWISRTGTLPIPEGLSSFCK